MGTKIEMLSTVPLPGIKTGRGVLWLAKKAARICLRDSGIDPSKLEMVIFAGMYRDKHIGEPSIASLLQKGIGVNPNLHPLEGRTFSFDVNTGGCGILNAIQLMDGFITSGRISKSMVITGDSEPFKGFSESYNFQPSASAIILGKSENNEGFKLIKNYSYPEYLESFKSYISWKKRSGMAVGAHSEQYTVKPRQLIGFKTKEGQQLLLIFFGGQGGIRFFGRHPVDVFRRNRC